MIKRLGDKYPVKYKFWCIVREILFCMFLKSRDLYGRVDKIHYDYWTYGKTLKELRELEEKKE